jgi:hypothetical protein
MHRNDAEMMRGGTTTDARGDVRQDHFRRPTKWTVLARARIGTSMVLAATPSTGIDSHEKLIESVVPNAPASDRAQRACRDGLAAGALCWRERVLS